MQLLRAIVAGKERVCEGSRPMRACVILNPKAGSVKDIEAVKQQVGRLEATELRITAATGEATRFARELSNGGCDFVIAAGGDGTLNEVVNGVAERAADVRVGILPLGTGNDFARTLNLPQGIDDNIDILLAAETESVDLVRVQSDETRYFVNVSAGGFSGLVDEKLTPEMKQTWGPLAYLRSAAAAFSELRAYRTSIALDDSEPIARNLYNVVVANGRYVAGGLPVAPDASITDGLLDILLIPETSTADLAVIAAQIALGKHLTSESIVFRRAAKLAVTSRPGMWFNVDGELVGNQPALFEVLPRALNFVVAKQ